MTTPRKKVILVVGPKSDGLSRRLLQGAVPGASILHVEPHRLASLRVTLRGSECLIADRPAVAVLFRSHPAAAFSSDYARADQPFADSELSALWLAVLNLPSVWTINRYDAEMWYDGLRWPVWQRRLAGAGIPTAAFSIGGQTAARQDSRWLPYGGQGSQEALDPRTHAFLGSALIRSGSTRRALMVCGRPGDGASFSAAASLGKCLQDMEIHLAEATFDEGESLVQLNTLPVIEDSMTAAAVARQLVEEMHDHLCHG
jgi:hypothetical protein